MAIDFNKIASGVLDMLAKLDDAWFADNDPAPSAVSDFTAVLAYTDDFGKIHVATTLYTNQHSAVCVDSIVNSLLSQVKINLCDVRQYTVVLNPTQFAGQDEWAHREIDRRIILARPSYLDDELISEAARKGDERLIAAINEMKKAQSNG